MQVAPSGGKIFNWCRWRHQVAKFTYASGAMLLPNLVQVTESISGSVVPLAMFFWSFTVTKRFDFFKFSQLFWKDYVHWSLKILSSLSSKRLQTAVMPNSGLIIKQIGSRSQYLHLLLLQSSIMFSAFISTCQVIWKTWFWKDKNMDDGDAGQVV